MADTADPKTKRTKIGRFPVKNQSFSRKRNAARSIFPEAAVSLAAFFTEFIYRSSQGVLPLFRESWIFAAAPLAAKALRALLNPKKAVSPFCLS
jgi:hypothetical protein